MHHESSQRMLLSMTLLAGLWIVVYWAWGPEEITPTVSFDDRSSVEELREMSGLARGDGEPVGVGAGLLEKLQSQSPTARLRVLPPRFRSYTVRGNESFEDIADGAYGDRTLWRVIAQANPLKDAERIKAGDVIRIPLDPKNVQGVVVSPQGERVDSPVRALPEYAEYVVKSGDTLSEISQEFYGTSKHARLIFRANRDSLQSMDDLKLGQTLRLPDAPNPED